MNVKAQLEFEFAYFEFAIQHFSDYAKSKKKMKLALSLGWKKISVILFWESLLSEGKKKLQEVTDSESGLHSKKSYLIPPC